MSPLTFARDFHPPTTPRKPSALIARVVAIIAKTRLWRVGKREKSRVGRSNASDNLSTNSRHFLTRAAGVRTFIIILLAIIAPGTVHAQYFNWGKSSYVNAKISGQVVDYTRNECRDGRIVSQTLGQPRDLYVYLPPGYDPKNAYPFILYLHPGGVDERGPMGACWIVDLDRLIMSGLVPPVVVAIPDGFYRGDNKHNDPHSLFVNGCGGAFEDFLINDIYPFVTSNYTIRPEREAHAVLGPSAGGYGGMGLAMKHREIFGSVATIAAPLNMRYGTINNNYEEDFHPETFRWEDQYNPEKIVGRFYCGLYPVKAKKYLDPVFACTGDVEAAVRETNPADLLTTTDLKPGELSIYVGYGHQDNYNFDAQSASFVWLAEQRGIAATVESDPSGKHDLRYFSKAHRLAFVWLGQHFSAAVH